MDSVRRFMGRLLGRRWAVVGFSMEYFEGSQETDSYRAHNLERSELLTLLAEIQPEHGLVFAFKQRGIHSADDCLVCPGCLNNLSTLWDFGGKLMVRVKKVRPTAATTSPSLAPIVCSWRDRGEAMRSLPEGASLLISEGTRFFAFDSRQESAYLSMYDHAVKLGLQEQTAHDFAWLRGSVLAEFLTLWNWSGPVFVDTSLESFGREANGYRDAIRSSYRKHRDLAESDARIAGGRSAHHFALFAAFATRFKLRNLYDRVGYGTFLAMGQTVRDKSMAQDFVAEVQAHSEVLPFVLMGETVSIAAAAEYILWQEKPQRARTAWLRHLINTTFKNALAEPELSSELKLAALVCSDAGAVWIQLLEPEVCAILKDLALASENESSEG